MKRFAGFCLMTEDVLRLSAFYRELFGIEADEPDNDVHQDLHGEDIGFAIYNDGKVEPASGHAINLIFEVDDVDAEHARLLAMGVTVTDPPTTRPWGMRNMTFLDPDGNRVTLRTPA